MNDTTSRPSITLRLGFAVSILVYLPNSYAGTDQGLKVSQVLDNVRSAVGYEQITRQESGVLVKGTALCSGVDVDYSLMFTPRGEFLRTVSGKLTETYGFDGKAGWAVNWTGLTRVLEMEQLEASLVEIGVQTGLWLAPESPLAVSILDQKTDDKLITLSLRLKTGLLEAELDIDRSTWRPVSLRRDSMAGQVVWNYEDYRTEMGFMLPHQVSYRAGQGSVDRFTIRSVKKAPLFFRNPYTPIIAQLDNTRFDADASPEIEVKRVPTGHLLVHPSVNGQDIGWFILDSGAGSMVISPKAADVVKMPSFGNVTAVAAGGSFQAKMRNGKRFELGPLTMTDTVYVEMDLDFVTAAFGIHIAGICGYDILGRAVVEIDPNDDTITIQDPSRYQLQDGRWQELFLDNHIPAVRCKFDGDHEGLFRLDTGAGASIIFHSPAVEKLNLLTGRETTDFTSHEAGGAHSAKVGQIEWFELAAHRFQPVDAGFSQADTGPFSTPYTTGTIGMGILGSFKMVFDYPHKRIAFIKQGTDSDAAISTSNASTETRP